MRQYALDTWDCPVCRKSVIDYDKAIYRVLMPDGLSPEVWDEAIARAYEAEEADPLTGDRRRFAQMLTCGVDVELPEADRVALGRAMADLGARPVALHAACAEETKDMPSTYTLSRPARRARRLRRRFRK